MNRSIFVLLLLCLIIFAYYLNLIQHNEYFYENNIENNYEHFSSNISMNLTGYNIGGHNSAHNNGLMASSFTSDLTIGKMNYPF